MNRTLLLPADLGGTDLPFAALGFTFETPVSGAPAWRQTTLPTGWTAKGLHPRQPLRIIDTQRRLRAVIVFGSPTIDPYMRLVPLGEYLDECAHDGTPIIPCRDWANPQAIAAHATARAVRAEAWRRDFLSVNCGRHAQIEADRRDAWNKIARDFTTLLEAAA
jgi:hypothetical protein